MKFVPHICCPNVWEVKEGEARNKRTRASGASSIIGPEEVESGTTVQYSYIHAQPGCTYTWSASKGRVVEGTYTAPVVSQETTDEISVIPFLSEDNAEPCAKRTIKIVKKTDCGGSVPTPTIPTSGPNQTQTVGIANPTFGASYAWAIISGGGSLSNQQPLSIDYTAPGSNANCLQNATIELKLNGKVCGTAKIAINGATIDYAASAIATTTTAMQCVNVINRKVYKCSGTYAPALDMGCDSCDCQTPLCQCGGGFSCYPAELLARCSGASGCGSLNGIPINCAGTTDVRTPEQKAEGCCPIQLM
jgi:hypothetical protein